MKKIKIAFDVDGTLRNNTLSETTIGANPRVIDTLIWLAQCKNTEIHIWSNRGEDYCKLIREKFGLQKYVKEKNCHRKTSQKEELEMHSKGQVPFIPAIAFDDQQSFDGGLNNIIVREK